jgi:glycosyltransferase involved in cell wall biosynthesis
VTPAFSGASESAGGVFRLPSVRNIGKKRFSLPLPAPHRIRGWISSIAPHVVHAHQPFLLGGTALRISRHRQIPLVFTHHTFYERYAHHLPLPPDTARRWVIDLTTRYANRCTLVIAPTASVRDILLERGVTAPIEIAPSGIDVELYSNRSRAEARKRFGFSATDEVVGHLGRLGREKNLMYLVEAITRLMLARPSAKWLLVGTGDRLDRVQRTLRAAGLADRLVTPGVLEGCAAADAYAAMDLFAFASHTDTQGLVLAEAMAAGVPVVALDAPGARDCVLDQVNGVLAGAKAAPDEFAQALFALLDDRTRLKRFSEAARQHAQVFARPRCLSRLLEVYARAIDAFSASQETARAVPNLSKLEESRT